MDTVGYWKIMKTWSLERDVMRVTKQSGKGELEIIIININVYDVLKQYILKP